MGSKRFQYYQIIGDNPPIIKPDSISLNEICSLRPAPVLHETILTYYCACFVTLREEFWAPIVFHARAFFVKLATRAMHHKFIDNTITQRINWFIRYLCRYYWVNKRGAEGPLYYLQAKPKYGREAGRASEIPQCRALRPRNNSSNINSRQSTSFKKMHVCMHIYTQTMYSSPYFQQPQRKAGEQKRKQSTRYQ